MLNALEMFLHGALQVATYTYIPAYLHTNIYTYIATVTDCRVEQLTGLAPIETRVNSAPTSLVRRLHKSSYTTFI